MIKADLVANLSERTKLSKASCEKVVNAFAKELEACLVSGDKLIIKGFASFEVTDRPLREGRNPKTGEVDTFPAVKSVKCRVSQSIKDAINGK